MSYCRFGEADAYIYESVDGVFQCCGCSLSTAENASDWNFPDRESMLEHIKLHRERGDYIPEHVDQRLKKEIAETWNRHDV